MALYGSNSAGVCFISQLDIAIQVLQLQRHCGRSNTPSHPVLLLLQSKSCVAGPLCSECAPLTSLVLLTYLSCRSWAGTTSIEKIGSCHLQCCQQPLLKSAANPIIFASSSARTDTCVHTRGATSAAKSINSKLIDLQFDLLFPPNIC